MGSWDWVDWTLAALVVLVLVVGGVALVVYDNRQQWPRDECLSRGYTTQYYGKEHIYCTRLVNGTSEVLVLGRYRE